jgi:hypothetical protein
VERGGAAAPFSLTFGQCPMWFVCYVVVSLHIWHLGTSLVRNSDVGPLFSFDSCFVFSRVNVFVNGCFIPSFACIAKSIYWISICVSSILVSFTLDAIY